MQNKLTINLPESPETLHQLLQVLSKLKLISNKKIQDLEKDKCGQQSPKTRWAMAAERLKAEGFLKGHEEEVKELTRDFRENFTP